MMMILSRMATNLAWLPIGSIRLAGDHRRPLRMVAQGGALGRPAGLLAGQDRPPRCART